MPKIKSPILKNTNNVSASTLIVNSKKKKILGISPVIETRDIQAITNKTGNIYESLNVIARRANQVATETKEELKSKLDEFASHHDSMDEIHENKEQIEISRYYERLPHATLISLQEFSEDKINFRNPHKEEENKNKKIKTKK